MNEKIKELAEQAGFQYIQDEGIGWAGNYNASLPKFAKLIVKQCIAMADDFECDVNHRGLVDRMKQHFGVKE